MNLLKIKKLDCAEVKAIYDEHYILDFPRAEQKPYSMTEILMKQGNYLCFGLFENNVMRGYAFFGIDLNSKCLLLDYFAILSDYRSGGYGGKFLKMLKGACSDYDGIILEVESPAHAENEEERIQRERRIAFYFANGLKPTSIMASMNKVVYDVLYYPFSEKWDDNDLVDDLNAIYRVIYIGSYYEECFDYIRIEG